VSLEFVLPGGESRRAVVVLQALEAPLEAALVGTLTPGDVPDLGPGPAAVLTERPTASPGADAVRAEIRWLRSRLDRLERTLDAGAAGRP